MPPCVCSVVQVFWSASAVVAGRLWGRLAEQVQVQLPGGTLEIHWPGVGTSLRMIGPAEVVFDGTWIPQGGTR